MLTLGLGGCASAEKRAADHNAARINTQLGLSYAERGQYGIALDKLKRAVAQDADLSTAHQGLAFVYQQTGQPELAEKHYRKALSGAPDDPALFNNFAVFLCGQNRPLEAESYFVKAARTPGYATPEAAWSNAGRCLRRSDPARAERYLREALKIRPDDRIALAEMARISYAQQQYLRTRAFLQRYDLRTQASPDLLLIAVHTEAALGDPDNAQRFAQRLVLEFPESAEAAAVAAQMP